MTLINNLTIGTKALLAFLSVCLFATAAVALLSFRQANSALEKESFNKLTAVREIKASQIENYFQLIRNQIVTFSENGMIVEAMKNFKQSFHAINNKNLNQAGGIQKIDQALRATYQREFLTRLNANMEAPARLNSYYPNDLSTRYLQYQYIANNANETGSKHKLDAAEDGSQYSKFHKKYHPIIRNYLDKFGYYDIFLVDPDTGHIVYTVFKEVDYATSLINGPYKNSNIADAFRAARKASNSDFVKLTDFAQYHPSYNAQAAFIASPIFDGDKIIGIALFQMPIDVINQIMTSDGKWQEVGLGNSGETYIVGNDYKLKSQSRFLLEDKVGYLKALEDAGVNRSITDTIDKFGSAIGVQSSKTRGVKDALKGNSNTTIFPDYRGVDVLSAYRPLAIKDMDWVIMSEIDKAEAFEPVYALRNQMLATSVVILLLAGAIAILFARRVIVRPIKLMLTAVDDLRQGDGDLTYRLPELGGDEIGDTARSINGFVQRIQQVLLEVRDSVNNLSSASQQVNASAQSLSQGASEQAASVEETSASLEQMNASIGQNAENAKTTEDIAIKASNEATNSGEAVLETVDAMNHIAEKIELIEDIAYKTNLLALNAAIEAARAGEHGRGFAVVADEVRKLAERSQIAAQEIINEAKDSVSIANRAGGLLEQMVPNIKRTADLVQEITAASNEQASGVSQVNTAMEQLDKVAQNAAASSEELAATSEQLNAHAENLQNIIGFFRLEKTESPGNATNKHNNASDASEFDAEFIQKKMGT